MSKNTRILVLFLSLTLLLGAAIGITASAEDTSAPYVLSQNVEYGGNYALMYAITADSVTGETLTLAVYDNAECTGADLWSKTIDATEANQQTVKGQACYVFKTNGIAAKDMDVQYYVKVTAANGETVKRYSVAEYFYERLYKNGVAFETTEQAKAQIKLYTSALTYGANAQDVLCNYNTDANGELITSDDRSTFVTDTKYVYVEDSSCTIDGGYESGIFLNGTPITLTAYNSSATKFDLFDLTTGDNIGTVNSGDEVIITAHTKVVAAAISYEPSKYADIAEKYDGKSFGDISSFITVAQKRNATSCGVAWDPNAMDANNESNLFFYTFAQGSPNDRSKEVYSFKNAAPLTKNYVFETDLRLYCVETGRDITFMLATDPSSESPIYRMGFYITFGTGDNESYLVLKAIGGTEEYNLGIRSSQDNLSEWINIRYEVDGLSAGSATRLIVNGVLVDSFYSESDISATAAMQMTLPATNVEGNGTYGIFYFDNTYCGTQK